MKQKLLRLSSHVIGNSDDEINLRKAFANKSSIDIMLSKTQLSKMIQSGTFLGRLLGPLLKTGLLLIKNAVKPLANSVLIPLELAAVA